MNKLKLDYIDSFMKEEYEKVSNNNYFSDKKLEVISVDNGIILPIVQTNKYNTSKGAGGVIDEKLNYIEMSAELAYNMKNRVYGTYEIDLDEIDFVDETVIYLNYFYKHWGHYIIDIVSRLWFLLNEHKNEKYKVAFITKMNENIEIDGNYKEFLNLFGIDDKDIMIINRPTRFKKIIVPECSIYPGKYYTKEYVEIFERVRKNVDKANNIPKKIYLSRSKFKIAKEKEVGEEEIEEFFNLNGYISISPELLTLSEQIQYINGSEEIVCVSGTLPHNIMFAPKGKKVTIINKTYKINKHQEIINQAKEANITYIDSHISLLPIAYGKGPFILTINNNLKKFAKDRGYTVNKVSLMFFKKIYRKIWYIRQYIKKYNFKIYNDGNINWKKLLKNYIFR